MKTTDLAIIALAGAAASGSGAAEGGAPMSRAEWCSYLELASARTIPNLSKSARDLLVAHGAFESGFGVARAAKAGNNVFNLTAGSAWTGDRWTDVGGDTEYDSQGNVRRIDQVWRKYATIDQAVADYWSFLGPSQNRGRYVAARGRLSAGDLPGFCRELYAAGYFTLPVATYTARLNSVHLEVKGYLA